MDWIDLDQDKDQWRALLNMIINLRVSYNTGVFLNSCANGGFAGRAQLHDVCKLFQNLMKSTKSRGNGDVCPYISKSMFTKLSVKCLSLYTPIYEVE
jgi:hypothetical protein